MAVHAHYPSSALFFRDGRGVVEHDRKDGAVDVPRASSTSHHVLFNSVCKRLKMEPSPSPATGQPAVSGSTARPVSTGLRLALETRPQNDDRRLEQFLQEQGERLCRALSELQRRHRGALLRAAEDVATRRLNEKDAQVARAARHRAALEDKLSQLRAEAAAWQARALSEQAAAAALSAQLEQASVDGDDSAGEGCPAPAESAESCYLDPGRVEPNRACRGCRFRPATVVIFPCRHLCLCEWCEGVGVGDDGCPVCRSARTGSVQVFLS